MIVDYLHVKRVAVGPSKAKPPLSINEVTVLTHDPSQSALRLFLVHEVSIGNFVLLIGR
jgi:hypothetical protein